LMIVVQTVLLEL